MKILSAITAGAFLLAAATTLARDTPATAQYAHSEVSTASPNGANAKALDKKKEKAEEMAAERTTSQWIQGEWTFANR